MDGKLWDSLPGSIVLRMITFSVAIKGFRSRSITILTTLTDPVAFPAESFIELYARRWDCEINLRHIKTTMRMDSLRCHTPAMVRKELLVHMLVYNLARTLMFQSAKKYSLEPRQISFSLSIGIINSWAKRFILSDDDKGLSALYDGMLTSLGRAKIPQRKKRVEPRVVKRRKKAYPLMTQPRNMLRNKMLRSGK